MFNVAVKAAVLPAQVYKRLNQKVQTCNKLGHLLTCHFPTKHIYMVRMPRDHGTCLVVLQVTVDWLKEQVDRTLQ